MSHPLLWPSTMCFYPVGNTSAVCLTESLPPESKADVLLPACGDPRHILYTIYAEETNPLTRSREFDVTCCDVDVAILARNALLLTLLADDGVLDKLNNLWNLFYNMLIDQSSFLILFEQCRKLIPLAESAETWRAGPYGHFLTTCDAATLAGLRRMWAAYLNTASFSEGQAARLQFSFFCGVAVTSRKRKVGTTAARSAGPFASYANKAVSSQFRTYWSSGTTDDGQDQSQLLMVNPTFAFSLDGDEFAIHYATDPLCGFHLAEAFSSGEFIHSEEDVPLPQKVVRIAKDQFSRWCTSVNKRLKDINPSSSTFVVRMFAGDALRFCQALKYCAVMRTPVTPYMVAAWRLTTITLDEHYYGPNAATPAPLSFNVIDTSNILDDVGLVNVLIVTAPLLRKTPSAALYTEALTNKSGNSWQTDLEHTCGDLSTMALLLGIIPSTFMSQFTMRSNVYVHLSTGEVASPHHERLVWKAIESGGSRIEHNPDNLRAPAQSLSFLPEHLAYFLFHVYLQMFSSEGTVSRSLQRPDPFFLPRLQYMTRRSSFLHYTRRSFALLVHFTKTRIQTDWQRAMALFEKLVMTDALLLTGQNTYQELCCQLHLLGVYTPPCMTAPAVRAEYEGDANTGMFRDWSQTSIPLVVTLVLTVPRDAIALKEHRFRQASTPTMQCDMHEGPRMHCFAVTSATFGSLHVSGGGERRTAVIVEDADMSVDEGAGASGSGMLPPWRTGAPLIITFSVPSSLVTDFGQNTEATISLVMREAPNFSCRLMDAKGCELTVFKTMLRDTERVFVLAHAPVMSTSAGMAEVMDSHWQENVGPEQAGGNSGADVQVQMNDTSSAIQSFTIRIAVTDPDARTTLTNKKIVPTVVNSCSGSTRSLNAYVKVEEHTFPLRFPLPVDTAHVKLRVARKSSYIEVVAPLAPPDGRPERDITNQFTPLFSDPDDDGIPLLGSIHRLNLDRCPTFKFPDDQSGSGWFDSHLCLMFSRHEEERAFLSQFGLSQLGGSASKPEPDTFLYVKQTLGVLLRSAAEATRDSKSPGKAFVLCDTSRCGVPYLYVVVARMCLDVGSHTVVADAFVALGTPAVRAALETAPRHANPTTGAPRIGSEKPDDDGVQRLMTDADETAAWLYLLPRLTERCRTWPHSTNCSYRIAKRETQKVQAGERSPGTPMCRNSMCMCGLGVGTKVLPMMFERVAPYLTRAAFSPLISVPYLEGMGSPAGDQFTNTEHARPGENDMRRMPLNDWIGSNVPAGDAETPGIELVCRACGKEGGRVCSGCKRARYCSRGCQRADWKNHKKHCQKQS